MDPTQPTKKLKNLDPTHGQLSAVRPNLTRRNTTIKGAYSLLVTYCYVQNLSRTISQPSADCVVVRGMSSSSQRHSKRHCAADCHICQAVAASLRSSSNNRTQQLPVMKHCPPPPALGSHRAPSIEPLTSIDYLTAAECGRLDAAQSHSRMNHGASTCQCVVYAFLFVFRSELLLVQSGTCYGPPMCQI